MRFQVEAVAHELRNPGWFARWLARKFAPASVAPAGARVKPPVSPWMAFVHVSTAFLRRFSILHAIAAHLTLDNAASHKFAMCRKC